MYSAADTRDDGLMANSFSKQAAKRISKDSRLMKEIEASVKFRHLYIQ